ncbi:MAG: sigma-70 family RNA polymerase sigma factor [Planctomycetota bacterium]
MSPVTLTGNRPNPDTGIADTLDDLAALRRYAKTGDPRAFELVANRYEAMVLATCRRVLRNQADAEDAAQQAFVKLASHAGRVRSNAAAWLHACAMRTATDIARAAATRRRAEARAADELAANASSGASSPAEWAELESQLDDALAKLDPADRDLICARFLAGRSQADLAREAGVNPGTLHRRLNKALEKLRAHLYETGVSMSAVGLAGGLAAIHAASPTPGVALDATLAKIGLAGMPNSDGSLVSATSVKTIVTVVAGLALTAGILGGGAMILNNNTASSGTMLAVGTDGAEAPDRPKRKSKPHYIVATTDPVWLGPQTLIEADELRYSFPAFAPDGQTLGQYAVVLDIPGLSELRLRPNKPVTLRGTVTHSDLPDESPWELEPGDPYVLDARTDRIGRLHLMSSFEAQGEALMQRFVGARPAYRDAAEFPVPTDPQSLAGAWFAVQDWALILDKDDISLADGDWTVHRFRIIDWTDAGDHARIQAIAADSMDPRLVGKRLKLLLKREGDEYTLAYHYHAGTKLNDWPAGFTPGKDGNVQILTFSRAKP